MNKTVPVKNGEIERVTCVSNELLQIRLANATDRIYIGYKNIKIAEEPVDIDIPEEQSYFVK